MALAMGRRQVLRVDVLGQSVATLKHLGSDPIDRDLLDIKPHLAEGGHSF